MLLSAEALPRHISIRNSISDNSFTDVVLQHRSQAIRDYLERMDKESAIAGRPRFVILIIICQLCQTFPSGAPVDVCDSLTPRHVGTRALNSNESPYYLVQSSNNYGDNNIDGRVKGIKVELGGELFKGFIIKAIDPLTGKPIGNWVRFKGTDILPCSAITHTNPKSKRQASLIWVPYPGTRGYVQFEATIVRSFDEYYTGLVSVLPHQQTIREKNTQQLSKS
ncbi:putative ferric-chelate reductase 1 homolog [Oppia nitens]|uniref:putative ferric-chelate reductase 1 homolog n=1 Tax=Oppia nitens TaxID=1686743 RepID=UPI0023D9C703|nr:putative ferric-chelate reductase 1 homolog [Oppia nitens]